MKLHRYTVYPGKHAFQLWGKVWEPPKLTRKPERIVWSVRFDDTVQYALPGADQQDWNKGGGVSFDLTTNHEDSAMWSWRYDPAGWVDLGVYCHVSGQVVKKCEPITETMLKIRPGQTVRITLDIDYIHRAYLFTFQVDGNDMPEQCRVRFSHEKTWGRTIGVWFGGNLPAPKRIDVYIGRRIWTI